MTSGYSGPVQVVILAAGQGKRMKSSLPKVLHEVLGRPILARIFDAVDELSPEKAHLVVGHEAGQVTDFLAAIRPSTNYSTFCQSPQLGTGHALQQVVPALSNFKGTLLVTVSDTPLLTAGTLRALVEKHQTEGATVSLLTTHVQDAKNYGRIVRDRAGRVVKIVEDKDASQSEKAITEINPAIYCLEWPAVAPGLAGLKNDNRQGEYYLTDLVGWAADSGLTVSSTLADDWREVAGINSRLELSEAIRLMRDKVIARLALESGVTVVDPQNTWIAPEVSVGADTLILPGCYLMGRIEIASHCQIGPNTVMHGPVSIGQGTSVTQSLVVNSAIGQNCRVGPFAHLRDRASVADGCRIGNYVEIKASVVGEATNVSHLSYIGDAELGAQVNIGAGTITANYDHITHSKSRTTIGDGASTGSNSVLVAPVSVGKEAMVAAGTVVTRDVPEGALAVGRARQETKERWVERRRRASR